MRLTRRDAIIALGALGVGSAALGRRTDVESTQGHRVDSMLAVAEVVYPSQVTVDESFIETYLQGRVHASDAFDRRSERALAALDETARKEHGRAFDALSRDRRRAVLRQRGVDRTHSDPDGTTAQQVRYYLINELLYVLYTTPIGGQLLGIENPPGYPGGRTAYQEGPQE